MEVAEPQRRVPQKHAKQSKSTIRSISALKRPECTERLQEGVELIALAKVNLGLKAGFWSVESALGSPFMIHLHMTSIPKM